MMEQRGQLIATIEQDLSNALYTVGQVIAQEVSAFEQQVDRIFGINPSPATQPSSSQPGSGSGSGALTTALNTSTQAHQPVTPQSGSGSGSGSSATAHENAPTLRVKPLTGSGSSGSGSGSGSGSLKFGSTDTLEWAPAGSDVINWIDLSKGNKRLGDPSPTNPIVFDGSHNDAISMGNATVASVTVRNGYDASMAVTGSTTFTDSGTLVVDSKSTLHVTFGTDSEFEVNGGGTITNMILAGDPTGTFMLNGGTMSIDPSPGVYTENVGARLYVNAKATLSYHSYDTLLFTNDNLEIDVVGKMNTYYGSNPNNTLISSNGYKGDDIFVEDGGVLNYWGNGGVTDTFTVPIFLQNGSLNLSAASNQGVTDGGKLIVQDGSGYTFPNGSKESVYVEDPSSTVKLSHGATLVADNGYYQSDGTLETTDTTTCTLVDNSGTTTIAGGSVIVAATTNSYGVLNVTTTNLKLNGSLTVAIAGNTGNPGTSDKFNVSGTLTLQPASSLNVYVNGQPVGGNTWIIINSNNIVNNFATVTSIPQTNLNYSPNQPNQGKYLISF
jgi:hypothetical protein